jgi:hypothetical protein
MGLDRRVLETLRVIGLRLGVGREGVLKASLLVELDSSARGGGVLGRAMLAAVAAAGRQGLLNSASRSSCLSPAENSMPFSS